MLETFSISKTRFRIVVNFFINAGNFGNLKGLAEEMNESTNAIHKELNKLSEAAFLETKANQNKVPYKANTKRPFSQTVQQILFKHLGLDAIIDMILEGMVKVKQIIVLGDYTNGIDSDVIEVLIAGNQINESYFDKLATKIEAQIKRKLIFTHNDNNIPYPLFVLIGTTFCSIDNASMKLVVRVKNLLFSLVFYTIDLTLTNFESKTPIFRMNNFASF
jgi:hypothetical protein